MEPDPAPPAAPPLAPPPAAATRGDAPAAPADPFWPSPPPVPAAPPKVRPSPGGRVASLLLASLLLAFCGAEAYAQLDAGASWAAGVLIGAGLVVGSLIASIGLAPDGMGARLAGVSALRLGERGHLLALFAVVVATFGVFVLGSLVPFAVQLELAVDGRAPEVSNAEVTEATLLAAMGFNVVLLVVPVVLWVVYVSGARGWGALAAMGLRARPAPQIAGELAIGVALAILAVFALVALALGFSALGAPAPPNTRALEIGRALSLPGALAVATLAALTEEVYFRGFLQPRIGLLAQAILFGVAHISYFHALQVVATLVLGLAFGLAYRWTGSLWAPVAAHFAFNALMLVSVQQLPEI